MTPRRTGRLGPCDPSLRLIVHNLRYLSRENRAY